MPGFAAPLWDALKRNPASSTPPASWDNLHKENKNVFTTLHQFDGAKVDLTSILSPKFHISHSLHWASQMYPPTYSFGSAYVGDKAFLQGQISSEGSLSGRFNYNWFTGKLPPAPLAAAVAGEQAPPAPGAEAGAPPSSVPKPSCTTKVQAQVAPAGGQSMLTLEHEHVGADYSWSVKAVNPNPIDVAPVFAGSSGKAARGGCSVTGVYVAQAMQAVTPALAVGAEYVYQHPLPEIEESALSLGVRYAPPPTAPLPAVPALPAGMPSPYAPVSPHDPQQVFAATWQPSSGMAQLSYFRRVNQRLEVGAELQALATRTRAAGAAGAGRREAIASVGVKLDTVFATIRAMVDSHGKVSAIAEEKLAPGLSFQIAAEMDYSKPQGGAGHVGIGLMLEA